MLFIIIGKVREGSANEERIGMRAHWQYPEGIRLVEEYWPVVGDYGVISVVEADDAGAIMVALMFWAEHFEFSVLPAVTAEQGLAITSQMMGT